MAKSKRVRLIKKCDWLHRQLLLRKRGIRCERCGTKNFQVEHCDTPPWVEFKGIVWIKARGLDRAHIYNKSSYKNVRWDDDNVFLLCYRCHRLEAHNAISDFKEWVKHQLGKNKFEHLTIKAKTVHPIKTSMLETLKEELKSELLEKNANPM